MIDKVELPQSPHHKRLKDARVEFENAREKLKEGEISQTDYDKVTKEFLADRLRYDKLGPQDIAGIKSMMNTLSSRIAEAETSDS